QLYDVILKNDGVMLISADHGNIECMSDGLGNPHTAHTTNLVPFIMVCNDYEKISLRNGSLKDIAPTILDIFDIEIPNDMTGKSLLVKK
ncbi:MAG: 2,3-bisphosphoglycerate-independent phosphoglycerate mutase, partial [Alphaproteobacteria bacterium]|nr:2,3-bisphosphoglycerate-independent phosphoglycerate mutase [Alphaproteobacteria bacterium]